MKNIYLSSLICLIYLSFTGCKDTFLDRSPEDQLTTSNFYTSVKALRAGTSPLYCAAWFDYNTRPGYLLGDIRAGNCYSPYGFPQYSLFTLSATDGNLLSAWNSFYVIINQATTIKNNITKYSSGVTDVEKNNAIAECKFMRAVAYFYLVRLWGAVPIIDNNSDLVNTPQVPKRPIEDVYKYIIRDLTFAAKNLYKTDDKGRVTQWAAKGMLSKVYLAFSGYGSTTGTRNQAYLDSAVHYAGDVCRNYPSELLPSYENLFKYKYNNNQESLFALQWVPLGAWGTQNATLSDFAYSTDLTGGATAGVSAWGSTMASYDILRTYEKGDTVRRNATFLTAGSHYSYINISGGGYTYKGYSTNDTITSAHFKKYVPGGPKDDNDDYVATMSSPLNTYILRLSDVYLTYAEAALGNSASLSSGEAFTYFNKVRTRAGLKPRTSITMDSIMYERRIEFGMEAQHWYDMVRWWYFMPSKILSMINNQHREASYKYLKRKDGNIDIWLGTDPANPATNITSDKIMFPIPETEAVADPLLSQDPVPYTFIEE